MFLPKTAVENWLNVQKRSTPPSSFDTLIERIKKKKLPYCFTYVIQHIFFLICMFFGSVVWVG